MTARQLFRKWCRRHGYLRGRINRLGYWYHRFMPRWGKWTTGITDLNTIEADLQGGHHV